MGLHGKEGSTEGDPNPGNNTDSIGNGGSAGGSADVSMVKTLIAPAGFHAGQSIQYSLLVSNGGPSTATNIQVTDTPTNLIITNVSGGGCVALPCTIPSLANGASTTITVTATIVAAGAFDNSATATGTESDPNPGNNTDNVGNNGSAVPAADVSLVKTLLTAGPFSVGQSIQYSLVVANAGPSTATSVQVNDLPTNITITNVSGGGCAAFQCGIASIASGANVVITVTATITAPGAFDNEASALATEMDPNLANNLDNTGNNGTTGVSADVSVFKTLTTSGPFTSGQSIAYTLLVANTGPETATNIQVTDTPTNLTITNVNGGGCAALPCTIPSLTSGTYVTINVTATIIAAGAFDNSTAVSATEPDPNLANNTDNTGNGGTAAPVGVDVGIVKSANVTTVTVGQVFSYTLLITNHGPGTATGVTVTDPLPPTFALINASSTQGSCSGTTTVICTLGTLANGASATITLQGQVTASGMLNNTATVTINEADGVVANNTSVVGISASVANIPTASEYGLMMLALLLGFAGIVVMRRS